MADKPGHYWDLNECGWVRYPLVEPVAIPEQTSAMNQRAVEAEREADVRSG